MKILTRIIDSIFPPRCLLCGLIVGFENSICEACSEKLKPVKDHNNHKLIAGIKSLSVFIYDKNSSSVMVRLKQSGDENIAEYLGKEIVNLINKTYPHICFDIVTTVPMSSKKYKEYGFNHSELLSEVIADKMKIQHIPDLLGRSDDSRPQHELSAIDRILNAKNSYFILKQISLKGKNILLIDDIITTGATLEICSELILSMGAKNVYCAAAMVKQL